MTLAEWLKTSGTGQSELGRQIGVTRAAVHNWVAGKVAPTLYYALAIEAISGGKVPAAELLNARDRLAIEGLRKKFDSLPPQE